MSASASKMHMDMSQEPFVARIYWNNVALQSKCIWTIGIHKGLFWRNLQCKCRTLIPGPPFRSSLRSRNAHGHFTRELFCAEIYRENARRYGYDVDQPARLDPDCKNPFSVATLFGELGNMGSVRDGFCFWVFLGLPHKVTSQFVFVLGILRFFFPTTVNSSDMLLCRVKDAEYKGSSLDRMHMLCFNGFWADIEAKFVQHSTTK